MLEVGFLLAPGFQMMSTAAMSVFEMANVCAQAPLYRVSAVSEDGGGVASSLGMRIETRPFGRALFDTLIVGGQLDPVPSGAPTLRYLGRQAARTRRVASICTAAFILGEAGLIDGRRVTTHWQFARALQDRHPRARVEEDRIFVDDRGLWTSAGMSSGIDMALAMLDADHGPALARKVAQLLVMYHRRAGGQRQHSALLELDAKSDRIQDALNFARSNLKHPLSVEQLAEAARLSPRQFSRRFCAETGESPARAVEGLRVEAARLLLQTTAHPVETIARETGFDHPDRMRRAFLRRLGQPPSALRG
jgi:transcriptional regulator GlxA family with amidase domain